jgi:hypothetical protein
LRIGILALAALSFAACSGASTSGDTGTSASTGSSSTSGGSSGTSGLPAGAKRIFVSSASYVGSSLTGVAGADQRCSLAAQAQDLGGTWKAIVSSNTQSPTDRIADVGPWYLLDGTKVFNNKAGLASTPLVPINIDEQGEALNGTSDSMVWTGTLSGAVIGYSCDGWGGSDPEGGTNGLWSSTSQWLDSSQFSDCGDSHHLYCIEQ